MIEPVPSTINELGLQFTFGKINPENGKIEIAVQEKKSNNRDFIVMQAMVFPFINILWIGCIIMGFGTFLAIIERIKKNKK
jgi:cytochrome c-type biogenesis protein CcmF